MADDSINPNGQDTQGQQDASEGLHIHGRGHEALEDGAEQPSLGGQQTGSEDVFGNANVQTGRRSTFEGVIDGQPDQGATVGDQSPVVGGEYTPQDPTGDVDAEFDSVRPGNSLRPPAAAEDDDEDDDGTEDEEGLREPALERPEDRVPGNNNRRNAASPDNEDAEETPFTPTEDTTEPPVEDPDDEEDDEEEDPVAETPTLVAVDTDGVEDEPIRLDLQAVLNDIDGTETLSVTVSGMPDGFSFVNGAGVPVGTDLGDGLWSIPPSQLGDLYLARPEHFSGDVPLTVTATATEINGDTSTVSSDFTVHVEAVADAPDLATENVAGMENQWHDLTIDAGLVDADGSESLTVYVTDVPDGATLDQGTRLNQPVTLGDGTVLAAGTWVMTAEQAAKVRVLPAENDSADFTLRVYAETTEDMNGDRAVSGPSEIHVDVGVVAPSVSGTGTGEEDSWVGLDLSANVNAKLGDENLQVLLEDLPEHAILRNKETGEILDTSKPLDISDLMDKLEVRWGEDTPMQHSDEDISFNLRAIVRDTDVGTATETPRDTNETLAKVTVNVTAVADDFTIAASGHGNEDSFGGDIAVPITIQLTDTDGSEKLVDTIDIVFAAGEKGTLTGAGVTGPFTAADGTITYRVPASSATLDASTGTYTVNGLVFRPTPDSDEDVTFSIRATIEDNDDSRKTVTQDGQTIVIDAVADAPDLAANNAGGTEHAASQTGDAGTYIEIDVTQFASTDDDTSESLTLYVGGVPEGGVLTLNGVPVAMVAADDIDFTGVDTAGAPAHGLSGMVYKIPGFDPATDVLAVRPPTNSSKDFDLRLVAVSDEANGTDHGNAVERNWSVADVRVDVGVLAPELSGTFAHSGDEGETWTALNGMKVSIPAASGGLEEETVTITLRGDDLADADLRVVGPDGVTVIAEKTDGSTTFTVPASAWDPATGTLSGLQIRWTDDDRSGEISFELDVHVADQDMADDHYRTVAGEDYADEARSTQTVTVDISPTVDDASLGAHNTGYEDAGTPDIKGDGIAITPKIQLSGDESESLTGDLVLTFDSDNASRGTVVWVPAAGGPAAADVLTGSGTEYRLDTSVFIEGPDGSLIIDPSKGSLQFVPTEHLAGDVNYDLTVTVSDGDVTKDFTGEGSIAVEAVADKVNIDASGAGNEDNDGAIITVPVSITLVDQDGSEALTGTIDLIFAGDEPGVLTGVDLPDPIIDADGNKVYKIPVDADYVSVSADGNTYTINGLGYDPKDHSDRDVSFDVRATSRDSNGDTKTTLSEGNVIDIVAVADKVRITATDTGAEEADAYNGIDLNLSTSLVDTDGSETLTLFITLPDGADARTELWQDGVKLEPVDDMSQWSGLPGAPSSLSGGKTWAFTVTADDNPADILSNLTLMPPKGVSADINLALNAVTVEADTDSAWRSKWADSETLRIDIGTDDPTLSVTGDGTFSLLEGTNYEGNPWQTVDLTQDISAVLDPTLVDGTETFTVRIYGLPNHVDIRYSGTHQNNVETGYEEGLGSYVVVPVDKLSSVQFRMTRDYLDQDFQIKIKAVVEDVDVGTSLETDRDLPWGDSAESEVVTLDVNVLARADNAGVKLSADSYGVEDIWRPLKITVEVKDTNSETIDNIYMTGIPDGMELRIDGRLLDIVDGVVDLTGVDLSKLEFRADQDVSTYDGDLRLGIRVITREHGVDGETGDVLPGSETLDKTYTIKVPVWGIADTPTIGLNISDADGGGDPTDGMPSHDYGPTDISNVVLYLRGADGSIQKVKIEGFSDYDPKYHDATDLPLDNYLNQTWPDHELVAFTVKAGSNGRSPSDPDYLGPGEGDPYFVDDTVTLEDLADAPKVGEITDPGSVLEMADGGGTGGGTGEADTYTQDVEEDQWVTVSLGNGPDDILSAHTGETGTDVDYTSADGSETLTFRITPQDPENSRLSIDGEVQNLPDAEGNMFWTVTAEQLKNGLVKIAGGEHWHGDDLTFEVRAVATEADAEDPDRPDDWSDPSHTSQDSNAVYLVLNVDAEADKVSILSRAAGLEDQPVTMPLGITLDDADSSEKLVDHVYLVTDDLAMLQGKLSGTWAGAESDLTFVEVSVTDGVVTPGSGTGLYAVKIPAGAFTAPDFANGQDTYTLPGFTYEAPEHTAPDFSYSIYATTEDADGSRHTTVGEGSLSMKAVADAPTVTVGGDTPEDAGTVIVADEDEWTSLDIAASVMDTDTESLTNVELSGVPDDWTIGVRNPDGSVSALGGGDGGVWVLPSNRLADVVIKGPHNEHDSTGATLTLSVTSREDGTDVTNATDPDDGVHVRTATTTKTFDVVIDAVADAPTLTVKPVITAEEMAVKLDILPALTDTDGSESLTITITGDFQGGILTGAGVTKISDTEWQVDVGTLDDVYYVPAEDFSGKVNLSVNAIATEAESVDPSDDTATTSVALPIIVLGVADGLDSTDPILTQVAEDAGWFNPGLSELSTKDMIGVDAEGSESISVIFNGLPDTVEISMMPGHEDALRYLGTRDGKPAWAVEAGHLDAVRLKVAGDWSGELDIPLKVTVTESDGDSASTPISLKVDVTPEADEPTVSYSGGGTEDHPGAEGIVFVIRPRVGDADDLAAVDTDDNAEQLTSLSITIDESYLQNTPGLKAVINGAEYDIGADGNLIITLPDANIESIDGDLTVTLKGFPDGWSLDVPITVTVEAKEGDTTATSTSTWSVPIVADADEPAVFDLIDNWGGDTSKTSPSGTPIDLDLDLLLGDLDGSEQAYIVVSGVPEGMKIVDGTGNTIGHSTGDGRWIVPVSDGTGGPTALFVDGRNGSSATLDLQLTVTDTDPDSPNARDTWTSDVRSVEVAFHEGDSGGGDTGGGDTGGGDTGGGDTGGGETGGGDTLAVVMDDIHIQEDGSFVLNATITTPDGMDADSVIIRGLSNTVRVESAGGGETNFYALDNGDGTTDYVIPVGSLGKVRLYPPEDSAEDFTLNISATAQEGYSNHVSDTVTPAVIITPVTETEADGAGIGVRIAEGADTNEDSAGVGVELVIKQADADRSETLDGDTLTLDTSGVPAGAVLTVGGWTWTADGTTTSVDVSLADFGLTLEAANAAFQSADGLALSGLTVKPPADWHGSISLSVGANIIDPGAASGATWTGGVTIAISAVTDGATPTAQDVTVDEDMLIPLNIHVATNDLKGMGEHGSEVLSVVIEGVPAGMIIAGATNAGSTDDGYTNNWVVKGDILRDMIEAGDGILDGLYLQALPDWSAPDGLTLTVRTYQMELGTRDVVENTDTLTVTVNPVADTPYINPQDVSGTEDQAVLLDLNALSTDFDGSETVEVRVEGAPEGSSFTYTLADGTPKSVTVGAGGMVVLPITGASGLSFIGPKDASGTFTMTVTPIATDGTDVAEGTAQSFTVSLTGDADGPTLILPSEAPSGAEDTGILLNISATLKDTDGSESLDFVIGPADGTVIPADTTLLTASGRTISLSSDGTFTIPEADIAGLKLVAPTDWHGDIPLIVSARATEVDGDREITSAPLTVSVTPVNDAPTVDVQGADYSVQADTTGELKVLMGDADPLIVFADVDADLDPAQAVLSSLQVTVSGGDSSDGLGLSGLPISFTTSGGLATKVGDKTFDLTWDGGSQTLTFSGEGSYADYQTLAEAVILTNDYGTMSAGTRTVTFTATDGAGASSVETGGGLDSDVQITIDADRTVTRTVDDLHFRTDGGAIITGENDTYAVEITTDASGGTGGLGGFDILTVMSATDQSGDWTFVISDDGASVTATGDNGETLDIVFTDGTTARIDESSGDLLLDEAGASGYLTFDEDETTRINFDDIEKISGQF